MTASSSFTRSRSWTYSFHSLVKLVYENTTLELVAFADWPAGFTWAAAKPAGRLVRRIVVGLLGRCVLLLKPYTRRDSGFILLFRKETTAGFRSVTHVCALCGSGATIDSGARRWKCLQCGGINGYWRLQ